MTDTYPEPRVERLYGQWVFVDESQSVDAAARRATEKLMRQFRRDHLLPIEQSNTFISTDHHGDPILVAEARAAGLPPEQRLPQGWRRWFCAP